HPRLDHRGSTSSFRTNARIVPRCALPSERLEHRLEPVDELRLRLEKLHARLGELEPTGAIDLRELPCLPRAGWPLEREGVAPEPGRVEVALRAPRCHDLSRLLADRSEIDERPTRDRRRRAELLLELPQRDIERFLTRFDLALGDRPGPIVLPREERPARMDE